MDAYDTNGYRSSHHDRRPADRTDGTFDFYRRRLSRGPELPAESRRIMERAALDYAQTKLETHPELAGLFMGWFLSDYAQSVGGLSIQQQEAVTIV